MTATSLEPTSSAQRQASLRAAVGRLRTRAGDGSLDRWLLIAGGVLLPLGALLVLFGWYGAANTPRLFEQIPYLISGGLLGLGLVVAGGFTYFAFWLTRLVREGRAQNDRLADALGRIEALLAAGIVTIPAEADGNGIHEAERAVAVATAAPATGARRPRPVTARGRRRADEAQPEQTFVATSTGSMIHRPDCPVVLGRDNVRAVAAGEPGFSPCKICEPLAAA